MVQPAEMTTIEALASAWARMAEEVGLPAEYRGEPSPEAHKATQEIESRIREQIIATNDMRLFGLLHLLGQASLRMEKVLWPDDYKRIKDAVQGAVKSADKPGSRNYSAEEVHEHLSAVIARRGAGN